MPEQLVHFAKWINGTDKSGHLTSCGIWNPPSFMYFTIHASDVSELMKKITCQECLDKTTLKDII